MYSSDSKAIPETYIQGMTPSSLFQNLVPTKTSGDLVDFGECGYLCGESTQDLIGTGPRRLYVSNTVEDIKGKKCEATGGELSGGVLSRSGIEGSRDRQNTTDFLA
jgi:hypothetical protein